MESYTPEFFGGPGAKFTYPIQPERTTMDAMIDEIMLNISTLNSAAIRDENYAVEDITIKMFRQVMELRLVANADQD